MKLEVGKKVYHAQFGLGIVNKIDNETIAEIDFKGQIKRLMIRYAVLHEPTIEQLSEQTSHFIINQEFIDPNGFNAPLNRDQIQELSRELGRELPSHYQEYLLNFPQEIANFKREFLNAHELLTETYFRNSVESIIEVNKYFEVFELNHLIAIGDDGCGNYYAIKESELDHNVYFINHEGYLDKFINKYVNLNMENFDKLVAIEARSLEEYGIKIIQDSIEFYKYRISST
ncbi:MAG TPA: SMI1/KNR4 family protein [Saprospiraceae bacterium]|nr:SMI1/KNR4 family protein [Saprospiraceae bacterium]